MYVEVQRTKISGCAGILTYNMYAPDVYFYMCVYICINVNVVIVYLLCVSTMGTYKHLLCLALSPQQGDLVRRHFLSNLWELFGPSISPANAQKKKAPRLAYPLTMSKSKSKKLTTNFTRYANLFCRSTPAAYQISARLQLRFPARSAAAASKLGAAERSTSR